MQNNIPEFLYNLLNNQYGQNITTQIVNGYNSTRPITLRVNTLKSNTDYIKDILNRNNINYHDVSWYSDALILNNVSILQIKQLDIYKNGEIYLQSLSSMIPPLILSPQKDENILDMAAAPGGKTTQMLALSDNKAYITATEKNKIRAEKLKYNITKQNANRINVMVSDARNLDNFFSFDKILLDAPCSGSGTLNINNEKQLSSFTEDLINRSSKFQSSLLEKAITLLKHNHEIVYSTCSILKAENENILQKFISKNKIEIVPIDYSTFSDIPLLPTSIDGTLCISPSDLYEGFFVAKLRKL